MAAHRTGAGTCRVSKAAAWFLKLHGWSVIKENRGGCHLQAPDGLVVGKTICLKVTAPTDEEIIILANEIRSVAVPGVRVFRPIFDFPAIYTSRRIMQKTVTDFDPLSEIVLAENHYTYEEQDRLVVGLWEIWRTDVCWNKEGLAVLHRYSNREFPLPDPTLFDAYASRPLEIRTEPLLNPGCEIYMEGTVEVLELDAYERNSSARRACIAHYGCRCQVCGFDFWKSYGEIGREFIHVHHLRPLASIGAEYRVDPIADLRPVCPNCHYMLHRKSPPMSIIELRNCLATAMHGRAGGM